jgi:hypothetical protein
MHVGRKSFKTSSSSKDSFDIPIERRKRARGQNSEAFTKVK